MGLTVYKPIAPKGVNQQLYFIVDENNKKIIFNVPMDKYRYIEKYFEVRDFQSLEQVEIALIGLGLKTK